MHLFNIRNFLEQPEDRGLYDAAPLQRRTYSTGKWWLDQPCATSGELVILRLPVSTLPSRLLYKYRSGARVTCTGISASLSTWAAFAQTWVKSNFHPVMMKKSSLWHTGIRTLPKIKPKLREKRTDMKTTYYTSIHFASQPTECPNIFWKHLFKLKVMQLKAIIEAPAVFHAFTPASLCECSYPTLWVEAIRQALG